MYGGENLQSDSAKWLHWRFPVINPGQNKGAQTEGGGCQEIPQICNQTHIYFFDIVKRGGQGEGWNNLDVLYGSPPTTGAANKFAKSIAPSETKQKQQLRAEILHSDQTHLAALVTCGYAGRSMCEWCKNLAVVCTWNFDFVSYNSGNRKYTNRLSTIGSSWISLVLGWRKFTLIFISGGSS